MDHLGGVFLVAIVVIVLWALNWWTDRPVKTTNELNELRLQLQKAVLEKKQAELNAERLAISLFNGFKEKEINNIQSEINELASKKAINDFEEWKLKYTETIRSKAIKQSTDVINGKVSEHLMPFLSADFKFNPREARFLGSPIDMIVFEGMDDEAVDSINVHFLEIKTGKSVLNKRQKLIRTAIEEGRVYWDVITMSAVSSKISKDEDLLKRRKFIDILKNTVCPIHQVPVSDYYIDENLSVTWEPCCDNLDTIIYTEIEDIRYS